MKNRDGYNLSILHALKKKFIFTIVSREKLSNSPDSSLKQILKELRNVRALCTL